MLNRIYNFCWYAVGGLILLAAVLVSITRLLLPGIGNYQDDIQAWISNYMGYPVIIREVQADWRGWKPQLYLNGVKLLEPDSNNTIAVFENAYLSVNPVKSLWQREIVPESLSISGAHLRLIRELNGSLRISESSGNLQQVDPRQTQAFSDWLQQQSSIRLENVQLVWLDRLSSQGPLQLRDAKLAIRNDNDRMQIDGHAQLPQHYGNQVDFALDARGKLASSDWHGKIYLRAEKLQPAAWPDYSRWKQLHLHSGTIDIEIWSSWQAAKLESAYGQINGTDLLIKNATEVNFVQDLATQVRFDRESDNWKLLADISSLNSLHGKWPASTVQLAFNETENEFTAAASFILLEDLVALLPAEKTGRFQSGKIPAGIRINQLGGRLHDVRLKYKPEDNKAGTSPADNLLFSARFEDVHVIDDNGMTSISGIYGSLATSNTVGQIEFDSNSIDIRNQTLLINNVDALSLHGSIDWQNNDEEIIVYTDHLALHSHAQEMSIQGAVHWHTDGRVVTDLLGNLSATDLQPLKQFIPAAANPKLQRWLQYAPVSGQLDYASFILRGDLNEFPFNEQQGQFQVLAKFSDMILDYNDKWTPLYQLYADLKIQGDYLEIEVADGNIYGADIVSAVGNIKHIYEKNHVLKLDGKIESPVEDIIKFLTNSPLRDHPEVPRLQALAIDNTVVLQLDLRLPLSKDPNTIAGNVEFLGNSLNAEALKLNLSKLEGIVSFDGDTFSASNLSAEYIGQPVTIDIKQNKVNGTGTLDLQIHGNADAEFLVGMLDNYLEPETEQWPLLDYINGSSDWTVTIQTTDSDLDAKNISFISDLEGMQVKLPAPLGKHAEESRPLKLDWESRQNSNEYRVHYADKLQASVTANKIMVQLGSYLAGLPYQPGLTIRGNTDLLDINDWSQLIQSGKLINDKAAYEERYPVTIDLQTRLLKVHNQQFSDSRIEINRHQGQWRVDIDGPVIRGHIEIPEPAGTGTVTAHFDQLVLNRPEKFLVEAENTTSANPPADINDNSEPAHSKLDPSRLPALSVQINEFSYGDIELGSFLLDAEKHIDGLKINTFRLEKPGLAIDGQGDWRLVNNIPFSTFNINLEADKFANMLATFGYNEMAIDDGPANLALSASWPGAPTDFSLAGIQGELSLNIGRGQFLDIDPKAGRLFGLLSLQTLPRRLTLDFNDLFKQGFAFDKIDGKFSIEDGHAYTNNLFMDGPSALIHVTGRAGLVMQDYDQRVTIIPQGSDNLPLASAVFGPAGIGVGAVIYLAGKVFDVIPRQLDRLLAYEYTITGNWDDPVIEPYRPETAASVDLETED